jgi:hypothetical protein
MTPKFIGKSAPLSSSGLANVSEDLKVKPAEIWAVLHVETAGYGFLPDRRPKILFELHVFSNQTNQQFDPAEIGPDYGADGAHQYERLAKAIAFDEQAALRSASWGLGQIMGFNAQAAGFQNVDEMIAAMVESEGNQLVAMAQFLKNTGLDSKLRSQDWRGFAEGYNGKGFERNNYDKKLEAAFVQYSVLLPDLNVRTAQMLLTYLGLHPGTIDGVMGRRTRSALEEFQQKEGLPVTGNPDAATIERLTVKVG